MRASSTVSGDARRRRRHTLATNDEEIAANDGRLHSATSRLDGLIRRDRAGARDRPRGPNERLLPLASDCVENLKHVRHVHPLLHLHVRPRRRVIAAAPNDGGLSAERAPRRRHEHGREVAAHLRVHRSASRRQLGGDEAVASVSSPNTRRSTASIESFTPRR